MKHVSLMSLLLILVCHIVSAQEPEERGIIFRKKKLEIRAGYGLLTAPTMVENITKGIMESIVNPGYSSVDVSGSGAFLASVILLPDHKVSLGIDLVFDKNQATFKYASGSPQMSVSTTHYASLMGRMDLHYINHTHFKLYGSIAGGVCTRKSTTDNSGSGSSTGGAFHITPIGISVGRALSAWAELGFGYKGLLSGGLALRF